MAVHGPSIASSAIILIAMVSCNTGKVDPQEKHFLQACTSYYYGTSLKRSDAKNVCECILPKLKESGIDIGMAESDYKKQLTDRNAVFHDERIENIGNDCFSEVMSPDGRKKSSSEESDKCDSTASPADVVKTFLVPRGTTPTKWAYLSFLHSSGETFLVQADNNAGSDYRSSILAWIPDATCSVEMEFTIDPKYSGNRKSLVGHTVPLGYLSISVKGCTGREAMQYVSSNYTGKNYLLIDSVDDVPRQPIKVWGSVYCTMTSDGSKFVQEITGGKFALVWFFY